MSLQETFRLRKSILCQGILYAVFFFLATAAYSFLFFLDNPAQQGFKDGHAAAILGGAGVALFGFMLLLSLCMIRAYCVEQFRVTGTTLHARSVLQNQQFDRSEIQCVRWKTSPSGAIRFRVFGRTTRLDLHGFAREDRLRIIRIVRCKSAGLGDVLPQDRTSAARRNASHAARGRFHQDRARHAETLRPVVRRAGADLCCCVCRLVVLVWRTAVLPAAAGRGGVLALVAIQYP
jgi:hypothetical protein